MEEATDTAVDETEAVSSVRAPSDAVGPIQWQLQEEEKRELKQIAKVSGNERTEDIFAKLAFNLKLLITAAYTYM